ncbi:class I SAM-dependent methyltransferase [Bordetella sp. BOR01]|uniref:class I SAM-dependent methyltransferase n=1 Tax=Bordetella sp. BOR01 TaxID=2854779 RepID=UPI001C46DA93|nr:methyltransferase domain-containing protein [Bordetella sp. BOR01]MBV7483272.1 methyltransferase domain-containing protein [Bordetella sp. BOR01]
MPPKVLTGDLSGLPFGSLLFRVAGAAGRATGHAASRVARQSWVAERVRFLRAWRANPKGIGAIWPSSSRLAAAITRGIDPASGPCLELGAGTGAFTRALVARGLDPHQLALVEMDAQFAQQLRRDFPGAYVHQGDAAKLAGLSLFVDGLAGVAVCGLPLLNMPVKQQIGILRSTFAQLRPGGAVHLFTYGPRCPVPQRVLDRLGLRARRIETVLANVPPAHVWKLTRRKTAGALHTPAP